MLRSDQITNTRAFEAYASRKATADAFAFAFGRNTAVDGACLWFFIVLVQRYRPVTQSE
jgi:hypothetical protein